MTIGKCTCETSIFLENVLVKQALALQMYLQSKHPTDVLAWQAFAQGKCTQMSNIYYGNNILQIRQTGQF